MDILKDLVLNFFLIFICFILVVSTKAKNGQVSKLFLFCLASLAVIFCITFPIHLNEDFMIDLRMIPIMAVGLYGGWLITVGLMLVNIGYRLWIGGTGSYSTIILAVLIGSVISIVSPFFLSLSYRKKLVFSLIIGGFTSLLSIVVIIYLYDQSISFKMAFIKMILQAAGLFFIVLLWEKMTMYMGFHERLLRTEKMEIVSHLASSFSHEVRNPMTTVKGFLQLMTDPKIDREKITRYVSIAISEIDRAEAIIKEYLAFTKPNSGEYQRIDGDDLLKTSIEVMRPLANANSISINYRSSSFYIEGNKQRMQQVLMNLFKNSIEAMQSGGTLSVYTEVKQKMVTIHIEDTGIGMTKEQISRLGEPYFSTKGDQGTGLGMMAVYHIVESMGGSVEVTSQTGQGTKFSLLLPSYEKEVEPNPT
ncbi:ATP-binding protein [Bacillus sp. AK128]